MENAQAATSNSTSTTRTGRCQFAEDAGAKSLTKTWSGENMRRFDLNLARSHIGRRANLHLKDGSVIVNVLIIGAKRNDKKHGRSNTILDCIAKPKKKKIKVPLKEVEWVEPINIHLFSLSNNPLAS
jgi:hypothetical protein